MSVPLVTIVVPARNAAGHLPRCLASLFALDWPPDRREIIVADNASTDATASVAASLGARVVREGRRGAGSARNAGWRAGSGDLVAFTDSDCIVSPGWLRGLAAAFGDPRVAVAGGPLVPDAPRTVIEEYIIAKDILSQERALRDDFCSPPFFVTANAMFRRTALEEAGGFDPALPVAGEDADLCWRLQWAGWTLAFVPEARVTHCHRARLRPFLRQVRSYGTGHTHLFAKHRARFGLTRLTWKPPYVEILRGAALAPIRLVTGRTRLERLSPALDVLGGLWFLSGKIGASLRLRVWNV